MQITMTLASPRDAEALSVLTGKLLGEIMERIQQAVFRFDPVATEQRAAELLERGVYRVLLARDVTSDKAVGFLSMYESYALYTEGAYGTIPELYVLPEYRSQGLGTKLLEAARHYGKEQGWTRFEVTTPPLPEFDRTLAFYEGNGFEISGGRKLKCELG